MVWGSRKCKDNQNEVSETRYPPLQNTEKFGFFPGNTSPEKETDKDEGFTISCSLLYTRVSSGIHSSGLTRTPQNSRKIPGSDGEVSSGSDG